MRGVRFTSATSGQQYDFSRAAPLGSRARRGQAEDAYFDDEEIGSVADAFGGGGAATPATADGDEDPLDAYMAELEGRSGKRPPPSGGTSPSSQVATQRRRLTAAVSTAASGSTAAAAASGPADEDEVDPLDAFMAELGEEPCRASSSATLASRAARAAPKALDEEEDHVASFLEACQQRDEADIDKGGGDEAAEPSMRRQLKDQKGTLELLPEVDHSSRSYASFEKEFYAPAHEVASMTDAEVAEYRGSLRLGCSGFDVPAPIKRFEQAGLDAPLLHAIRKHGYETPTPIQCQTLPVALSGRDVIGIASTGSGKTAAYLLPMITHLMHQPELQRGEGPIAMVVAPTHELAEQIVLEARRFGRCYGLRSVGLFGGVGKYEQFRELKAGAEIAVGTPGRMLELIRMKAGMTMERVTFVVLDEADRMFSMGFEPQVRSLLGQIRPDRQTLLFSATFRPALERLAREVLSEPVRVTVGEAGDASEDVTQVVEILTDEAHKWRWLEERLPHFERQGTVLIFVSTKLAAEELARTLTQRTRYRVEAIHGDRTQADRQEVLRGFKKGQTPLLVATDVASRGLDIPAIKTVINYDVAKKLEDHTHRIGRTGRAGSTDGVAYTLITKGQQDGAVDLVRSLRSAKQQPPEDLLALASRSRRWASSGLQTAFTDHSKATTASAAGSGAQLSGHDSKQRALSEFAPPQFHGPQRMLNAPQQFAPPHAASCSAQRPPPPPPGGQGTPCNNAAAMAAAIAARLSAQAAKSSTPSRPPPAPPLPPSPLPAEDSAPPERPAPTDAALAAARAVAARLSAGYSARPT